MNDAAMTPPLAQAADHAQFVTWLRQVAPYVHAHRGRTFVIAFSGSLIANGQLTALIQDVSLLSAMGIRIVLVHGSRPQVQAQLALKGIDSQFHNDLRITDAAALECAKEAAGEIRLDIEAAFSQGLPSTPMAHSKVRVISGNFVTARPMGIIDGVDLQLTGVVRKVDTDALRFVLANGGLVLLSPLGFSPTGEAFNLTMEDVACSVATALKADKLVLLTETAGINDPDGALRSETLDGGRREHARPRARSAATPRSTCATRSAPVAAGSPARTSCLLRRMAASWSSFSRTTASARWWRWKTSRRCATPPRTTSAASSS